RSLLSLSLCVRHHHCSLTTTARYVCVCFSNAFRGPVKVARAFSDVGPVKESEKNVCRSCKKRLNVGNTILNSVLLNGLGVCFVTTPPLSAQCRMHPW
ncbi:AGAP008740-PA, partial [Anopheles gambiae str. PEST]